MLDGKMVTGAVVAMTVTASSWVEQANEYGMLVTTCIGALVGIATLWYMIEKARKLRRERKDDGTQ